MKENLYTPNSIRCFSGQYVNLLNPDPDTLLIEDIAHALANMPRFGGHTRCFYSVAQHSVLTSYLSNDPFSALMHDCSEAYLMDIPKPLKDLLPEYKIIESRFMEILSKKFGFIYPLTENVKNADQDMLLMEWDHIMLGKIGIDRGKLKILDHKEAEQRFLNRFNELTK